MRILQIAPLLERVPPRTYGGTQRIVHTLTEELVKRGHNVTLFASGDSITSAKLASVYPTPLRETSIKDPYGPNPWNLLHNGLAYNLQDQFDIIHDHNADISIPLAHLSRTPVVITLHNEITPLKKIMYKTFDNPHYVTISKAQTLYAPKLNHAGTVYNGLSMNHYPFSEKHEGYLLYVGSIQKTKGVHYAIEVAEYLDLPLILAGKVGKPDMPYFSKYIRPKLSSKIKWIGEVDEKKRNSLMSKSLCFIHAATWQEPFGLTLIESMSCGTPVIGFNKGSVPEIIQHGKSGFIVENVNEIIYAVKNIDSIKRKYCREYSLSQFNSERMVQGYEEVYRNVILQSSLLYPKKHLNTIHKNQEFFPHFSRYFTAEKS